MWNDTDWRIDTFELHDGQQVWTPTFSDESDCGLSEGCISKVSDVALNSDGKVTARLTFRYPSFCHINFYRYPEETNDCKLFLILSNTEHPVKYDIQTRERAYVFKPVIISKLDNEKGSTILTNVETSVWTVEDRTVEIVKIGEFKSDYIKLAVHAKKEMSTLKIALSLPVTIATMLMLVYTFYEFLFFLTFVSILVTLVCLALCRVKRSVPASHSLYLTAKPDPATNYQRHFEVDNTPFDTISNNGGAVGRCSSAANHDVNSNDYSLEWKHIYIAANNLFSGISFSIFCFVIIFGIL
ncbi:neurotransmitter-gated ion-channel ligand binding domain-containing protein [Ditylenchus destructor]|nr:neurotransmitter-gated ion-channel ligand binding domain-containing protein [Ditylenchus destructor]